MITTDCVPSVAVFSGATSASETDVNPAGIVTVDGTVRRVGADDVNVTTRSLGSVPDK